MTYFETTPGAHADYREEKRQRIGALAKDEEFRRLSNQWRAMALDRKYMNNFSWWSRPLIQLPGDMVAMQEIVLAVQPDIIVECGIAHGGAVLMYASLLEMLGKGEVVGVDVEIRAHNRQAIESHPMAKRVTLIEGSSTDVSTATKVKERVAGKKTVLVCLDSNHTHDHVLKELELYAPLVTSGSYCVVFDTFIEDMPDDFVWTDRPWSKGDNPKTAIHAYLKSHPEFEIDKSIEDKVLLTSAPDGFLRRK
ncbi:MAG TPA: cephalosporin hydroxylase family protein [Beijerinckiaceae bacterium]|jgi:cephalosporin hydroxylase|nr:cephalosporin hydroxylase family protein [Beijerinckiaceae bacterium]